MAYGDSRRSFSQWQAPTQVDASGGSNDDLKMGWLRESVEEGQGWLRSQRGYADYQRALDTISGRGDYRARQAGYKSKVAPNRLKRNIREVVGVLSKLRPIWGYHSENSSFKGQAGMFNTVMRAIYLENFYDVRIKDALKYAAATARGWVCPVFRRSMGGTGEGNEELDVFGAPSILPNQLPSNGDFQQAYVMHILDEWPVYLAHARFPRHQQWLTPSSARYWYQNDAVRTASIGNVMNAIFGKAPRRDLNPNAVGDTLVPMCKTYIIDLTVNRTSKPIQMGPKGTSWAYEVPYVGMRIPAGPGRDGKMTYREANENDARLYPNRRLMIWSDKVICYDGPSFNWHGMFPGISFAPDSWPWEPLGFSMVHDSYEINETLVEIYRGNADKVKVGLNLPIAYDKNAMDSRTAKMLDPMMPHGRYGYDGQAVEPGQLPFQSAIPHEILEIDPESMNFANKLEQLLDSQLALNEMRTLAEMREMGADDLEKLTEIHGPIVDEMSRGMEPPMRDLGIMTKFDVMQYYNVPRIISYVGADGVTPVVVDYDPTKIYPSHMPGEFNMKKTGTRRVRSAKGVDEDVDIYEFDHKGAESQYPAMERAKFMARNLKFYILPNTLHELAQMSQKLALIQLKKSGVKIDSQTCADAFNVPNYGTLDGNTVLEKFASEAKMDLIQALQLKSLAAVIDTAAAQENSGTPPPVVPPMDPVAPPGAPGPGGAAPEGRPPTFAEPPQIVPKDGGTRSTISTSGK